MPTPASTRSLHRRDRHRPEDPRRGGENITRGASSWRQVRQHRLPDATCWSARRILGRCAWAMRARAACPDPSDRAQVGARRGPGAGCCRGRIEPPVGDVLDPTTVVDPIISEGHRDRVIGMIDRARAEGPGRDRCSAAGRVAATSNSGFFVEPIVIDGVDSQAYIAQEEVFGPVLSVDDFHRRGRAVALAQTDTPYGLAGYVHTNDLRRAHRGRGALDAGYVSLNSFAALPRRAPSAGSAAAASTSGCDAPWLTVTATTSPTSGPTSTATGLWRHPRPARTPQRDLARDARGVHAALLVASRPIARVHVVVLTGAGDKAFCVGADFGGVEGNLDAGYPDGIPGLMIGSAAAGAGAAPRPAADRRRGQRRCDRPRRHDGAVLRHHVPGRRRTPRRSARERRLRRRRRWGDPVAVADRPPPRRGAPHHRRHDGAAEADGLGLVNHLVPRVELPRRPGRWPCALPGVRRWRSSSTSGSPTPLVDRVNRVYRRLARHGGHHLRHLRPPRGGALLHREAPAHLRLTWPPTGSS